MSIREKRHRLARDDYRGQVEVAFTTCLRDRSRRINDFEAFHVIKRHMTECSLKKHCTVPVLCLMPDHLHVLMRGETVSADCYAAMAAFKVKNGTWLAENRPGTRWQKDFYDHIVRSNEDSREQARYIAANPCRKGLVTHWYEWPFTCSIGHDVEDWLV